MKESGPVENITGVTLSWINPMSFTQIILYHITNLTQQTTLHAPSLVADSCWKSRRVR